MPVTGFNQTCLPLIVPDGEKTITFPGGAEISMSFPSAVPITEGEQLQALFAQFNTALSPLQPVFNIIEAIIAIFKVICALAHFNIPEVIRSLPNLAEKIDALIKLIPQLSVPLMVVDFINHLITYLDTTIEGVKQVALYQARIIAAETAAADAGVDLSIVIDCAKADVSATLSFMGEQAKPVNQLLDLVNAFLSLIGIPCLPSFSNISLSPGFIESLEAYQEFLAALEKAITIPLPKIPLGLDSEDCN